MAYTAPSVPSSGTTFSQFLSTGAGGILEKLISAMGPATAAPGAPTLSATGGGTTGGSLPAGSIYIKVTETNGVGETTPYGTEVSATIAAGNVPQVTFAALQAGNLARNVYVGTASGAEVLYATGITAGTYNLSAAIPTNSMAVAPPTTNTTGLSTKQIEGLRSYDRAALQGVWDRFAIAMGNFLRGDPMAFPDIATNVRRAHVVFVALAEVCNEIGVLVDANPGTFRNVGTSIGGMKVVRQWP